VRDTQSASGRIRRGSALLAVIMLWGQELPLSADEVYKSVDAEGHVVYSDRAPSAKAQKSEVRVVQPDAQQAARNAREQEILNAEDKQRKQREAAETAQAGDKALQEQQKTTRCNQARDRYNLLKDVNLIYHLDGQGNRVYDTDTQADAKREAARQAMQSACAK
jgi:hypothetical protein